jgi:hypothetical protein
MPAPVAGIHVFLPLATASKTWMAGTEPGHDVESVCIPMKGPAAVVGISQSSGSTFTIEAPWLLPTQKVTGVVELSTQTRRTLVFFGS